MCYLYLFFFLLIILYIRNGSDSMIMLCLLIIPIIFILIKLILYLIVKKYGKISYDGFSAVGFAYNSQEDIFYSTKNAWQKNFGYTHMYDVFAPLFRMIIDTESIKFYYNNKNWLISFWKGQYGIVTGAEVGIYCTNQQRINKKTVYLPVNDLEMLSMDLVLYKNEEVIAKASAKHWWMAIFKLGMFSRPKDLTMDINITFQDKKMLEAFLDSFKKLGYDDNDFRIINNTFCFKYIKPHTRKVLTRTWMTDMIRQFFNRKNVELYNEYLIDLIDDNKIDDSRTDNKKNFIMINELLPDLLKNKLEEKYILENLFDDKDSNVIFLDSNVYTKNGVDKL